MLGNRICYLVLGTDRLWAWSVISVVSVVSGTRGMVSSVPEGNVAVDSGSCVDGIVGMGAVVGNTVGVVVSSGRFAVLIQPVNAIAVRTNARNKMVYFFMGYLLISDFSHIISGTAGFSQEKVTIFHKLANANQKDENSVFLY